MDFPFVGNPWNAASYRPRPRPRHEQSLRGRGIPIHLHPEIKPKVVSIPVHFVGSEPERRRPDPAVVIQKVFRGFLVRKNMKKMKAIKEEVSRIELTVSKKETVDSIRKDSKERLKVNETLMSFLIKLDSVRGVDSGVRDFRKSVIKKVIALQERVDAIVAGAEAESVDQNQGVTDSADDCNQTPELENHDEVRNDDELITPNSIEAEVIEQDEEIIDQENNEIAGNQENEESQTDSSANPENIVEEEEEEISKEEKNRSGENRLLERMMEDNERMMGLMTELFQRNEMQTRLLSALSQRVEQLERAFLCDKLRKKKKRAAAAAAASVDCADKSPQLNKCGNR